MRDRLPHFDNVGTTTSEIPADGGGVIPPRTHVTLRHHGCDLHGDFYRICSPQGRSARSYYASELHSVVRPSS